MSGAGAGALLNEAFDTFRDASRRLEENYAVLEERVKELNAELAEKNRVMERTRRLAAMGEMAARIAHEIRNPLGSISLFASMLERDLSADEPKKGLAGRITMSVKTLDNILSNMLLFASAPSARRTAVRVREVIEDALMLSRAAARENVSVRLDCAAATVAFVDEGLMRQLFLNLFLNAFDAMPGGGVLSVSASVEGGPEGAVLGARVADTGCGIPSEHADRIFDPFYSTKARGTGLGLAIVNSVVAAHGGAISVRSRSGEGTEFSMTLPAAAPAGPAAI